MKRYISLLTALAILCGMLMLISPNARAATGDEVRAAKKIISVVYDDSGSMKGERWAYCSYAMQALTAQLNAQDELYITYMSSPSKSVKVDLNNVDKAVTDIRDWNKAGSTPGEALDTARDKLDQVRGEDPSTQYWLVILTDGSISMSEDIQTKLNGYKGTKMDNGATLNVVYFAMGSGVVAQEDESKGLYTFDASSAKDIFGAMSTIAKLISGRLDAEQVKQVNETTVSFSSKLPLYSISVLSQNSTASVVSASSGSGGLDIARNIPLEAKEPFGNFKDTFTGNATVINKRGSGSDALIPADSYTVTFSQPVSLEDLVIQYEPAIGLKLQISRDGVAVKDTSALQVGEKVSVEIIPVIPGTDTKIEASALPKGISWTVEYVVDGNVDASGSGTKLDDVILKPGNNLVRGIMQIPGFAPSVYEIGFSLVEIIYNFGIQTDQPQPLSYYRKGCEQGSKEGGSVTFWLTNDGVPMDKAGQDAIGARLEIASVSCDNSAVTGFFNRLGSTPVKCALTQNADGSYTLTPRAGIPFTAFLLKAGEYTVTVQLNKETSVTAAGTFTMIPRGEDWVDLLWLLAVLAALGYLIYIFFVKYKFKGRTVYYEVWRQLGSGKGVESGGMANSKSYGVLSGGLLLPTRACRVKSFGGLVLEAGPEGSIIVTGKSIARCVYGYKQSSADPKRSLGTIVSSMKKTERKRGNSTERVAEDVELSANRPVYFRSTETDTEIWRLYVSD